MNSTSTLFALALLLLGGVGAFFALDRTNGTDLQSTAMESLDQLPELTRSLESLNAKMDQMEKRLDAMPLASGAPAVQRGIDVAELESLVAAELDRQMKERGMETESGLPSEEAGALNKEQLLDQSIGQLLDVNLSQQDREALWESLKEQGLLEQAIALLEGEVEGNPENLDLLNELGYAYLQPVIRGGVGGIDAGKWSMKADRTYDRVLEADSENWNARFSKAVSYSFWPPMFGKQPEAIRHFEILVDQQSNQASSPEFAQTHLLLGNLYEQSGNHDMALEAWQLGANRFPEDSELRKQLGLE